MAKNKDLTVEEQVEDTAFEFYTELKYGVDNNAHLVFEKPEYKMTEYISKNNYGKFELEPLEQGFGRTLGNALRRVLLSSLPGDAITSVKIDGVMHEFQTIKGVIEDVTTIVLNLKNVVVKKNTEEQVTIKISVKGEGPVKASMLEKAPSIEIGNPDFVICNLAKGGKLDMELTVGRGKGYVVAEEVKRILDTSEVGVIAIDAIYSPIERVNYDVEKARVGHDNNFDKLIMEIWTKGSVTPQEALSQAASILMVQLDYIDNPEFTESVKGLMKQKIEDPKQKLLKTSIDDLELSVRAYNCLKRSNMYTVADLVSNTEQEMSKIRNLGKKSLKEVMDKVKEMGLTFKNEE
jgi:DNA-directed RNA polymerase subunit alpha